MNDNITIVDDMVYYSLEGQYLGSVRLSSYNSYDEAVFAALDDAKKTKDSYLLNIQINNQPDI